MISLAIGAVVVAVWAIVLARVRGSVPSDEPILDMSFLVAPIRAATWQLEPGSGSR